jgi:hypothetical protein
MLDGRAKLAAGRDGGGKGADCAVPIRRPQYLIAGAWLHAGTPRRGSSSTLSGTPSCRCPGMTMTGAWREAQKRQHHHRLEGAVSVALVAELPEKRQMLLVK